LGPTPSIIQFFLADKLIHQGENLLVAAEIAGLDVLATAVQAGFEGGDDLRAGAEAGEIPAVSQAINVEGI
jgi:hypothetical protein